MQKCKRTKNYELSLDIKDPNFIRPPREAQRNWILNRALKEIADDLESLNKLAATFVTGKTADVLADRSHKQLSDEQIMEDWQIPVVREMAASIAFAGGSVLEVGFGRGIAADFIQQAGVRLHTIIECNDSVIERFQTWRSGYSEQDIRLVPGRWQDVTQKLGSYDGILFHTYPLNETEFVDLVSHGITFAEHFFSTAAQHLKKLGKFTYVTNDYDSLSRGHQRALLQHFQSINTRILSDLKVPMDTLDAQWAPMTVLVCAEK